MRSHSELRGSISLSNLWPIFEDIWCSFKIDPKNIPSLIIIGLFQWTIRAAIITILRSWAVPKDFTFLFSYSTTFFTLEHFLVAAHTFSLRSKCFLMRELFGRTERPWFSPCSSSRISLVENWGGYWGWLVREMMMLWRLLRLIRIKSCCWASSLIAFKALIILSHKIIIALIWRCGILLIASLSSKVILTRNENWGDSLARWWMKIWCPVLESR